MKRILWTTVRPELQTWANLVTLLRLALGLVAFGAALATDRQVWNFVALAIYWGGDLLDGFLARRLRQETIFGAEFDILADRLLVCLFYTCYVSAHPDKLVVGLLFLFEFMVLDHFLSNQFVRWPIASPNYFHLVDRLTWKWLWSRPGKALNTGLVTLLTIGLPTPWPAACAVLGLIGVRVYFFLRVLVLSAAAREASRAAVPSAPGTQPDGHHDRRLPGVRIEEEGREVDPLVGEPHEQPALDVALALVRPRALRHQW